MSEILTFTGDKLLKAIEFHLIDEEIFTDIPSKIKRMLKINIKKNKTYEINKDSWTSINTGIQRLILLMQSSGTDPYKLIKSIENKDLAHILYNKFKSAIDSIN